MNLPEDKKWLLVGLVVVVVLMVICYICSKNKDMSENYAANMQITGPVALQHLSHAGHSNYIQTGVHENEAERFSVDVEAIKSRLQARAQEIARDLGVKKTDVKEKYSMPEAKRDVSKYVELAKRKLADFSASPKYEKSALVNNPGHNNGKLRERLSYAAIEGIPDINPGPNPGHQPHTSDDALLNVLTQG